MRTADTVAIVLVVLVALGAVLAVWRRRSRGPASTSHALDSELLTEEERRVLDAALAAVAEEHADSAKRLVVARVALLCTRRVPLRAIRPGDGPPVVRLVFADGTAVRARPERPGEFVPVVLATNAPGPGVVVESYSLAGGPVEIVLAGAGGLRRRATVVGLDQPS